MNDRIHLEPGWRNALTTAFTTPGMADLRQFLVKLVVQLEKVV